MHALYTDLAVAIRKVQIHSGKLTQASSPSGLPSPSTLPNEAQDSGSNQRDRGISVALLVSGVGRLGLSKERAEWDV